MPFEDPLRIWATESSSNVRLRSPGPHQREPSSFAQDRPDFPDGYDAVQAAPDSHKVIFENRLVRVLEVTVPPLGKPDRCITIAGLAFSWLGHGGMTPRVRYHRPDSVRDEPSINRSVHPGKWSIQWMKPEPMHAIEVIDRPEGFPESHRCSESKSNVAIRTRKPTFRRFIRFYCFRAVRGLGCGFAPQSPQTSTRKSASIYESNPPGRKTG